jgi:hypothetical protein
MRLAPLMRPLVTLTLGLFCAAACVVRRPPSAPDIGIKACPPSAAGDLLSIDALQCWFSAPHGPWRTLSHESHFAVMVVQVEAADLRDAESIARRFVASERDTFSEILVYAQRERRIARDFIRRVRWTQDTGFETLDFAAEQL